MDKRFWAIIGVLLLGFGGMLVLNGRNESAGTISATNHVIGNTNSKVTLLEYGDFQCSACQSFYPVIKQVKEKYADKIAFQFRNLPLSSVHPNAFAGSRAAEAAANQGKFWEMHDLLYENQDPRGASGWVASKDVLSEYFVSYAKKLNLNEAQFKADFASNATNKKINADIDAFTATKEKVSTPTFFINSKLVDSSKLLDERGVPSLAAFSKVIDEALAQQK